MLLGIRFPFQNGSHGLPDSVSDEALILDSLRRIIMTTKGERVMRPSSGSRVINMIFENATPALGARISEEVKQCIRAQEKRIQVVNVSTVVSDTTATITVIYRRLGGLRRAIIEVERAASGASA